MAVGKKKKKKEDEGPPSFIYQGPDKTILRALGQAAPCSTAQLCRCGVKATTDSICEQMDVAMC